MSSLRLVSEDEARGCRVGWSWGGVGSAIRKVGGAVGKVACKVLTVVTVLDVIDWGTHVATNPTGSHRNGTCDSPGCTTGAMEDWVQWKGGGYDDNVVLNGK